MPKNNSILMKYGSNSLHNIIYKCPTRFSPLLIHTDRRENLWLQQRSEGEKCYKFAITHKLV